MKNPRIIRQTEKIIPIIIFCRIYQGLELVLWFLLPGLAEYSSKLLCPIKVICISTCKMDSVLSGSMNKGPKILSGSIRKAVLFNNWRIFSVWSSPRQNRQFNSNPLFLDRLREKLAKCSLGVKPASGPVPSTITSMVQLPQGRLPYFPEIWDDPDSVKLSS